MALKPNDIGGRPAGPIDRSDLEIKYWEAQVDAIRKVLGDDVVSLDELRRGMEELGEEDYNRLAFFERRLAAMINILAEKKLVDPDNVKQRAVALQAHGLG